MSDEVKHTPAEQIVRSYLDREGLYPQGVRWRMLISEFTAALESQSERIRELLEALQNAECPDVPLCKATRGRECPVCAARAAAESSTPGNDQSKPASQTSGRVAKDRE